MYKVFIDHRPVLFITKEELSTNFRVIFWDESNLTFKKIKKQLVDIDVDNPLQVVCEDVKSAYKSCFEDFKKITAGGGIVESEHGFLLIKRKGMWDLPKGKIENNESIKEAALREVEEECGIKQLKLDKLIDKTYHMYKINNQYIVKISYWFLMYSDFQGELSPQLETTTQASLQVN